MKNFILSSIVMASLFIGCQSSGGLCCDGDLEELQEQEWYLTPVAVLDNRTVEIDGYPALALSGVRSYDRDESNQKIVKWDWNITSYDSNNEIIYTDPDCTKTYSGVDVNVTYFNCLQAVYTIIQLTVTDDENQRDISEKNITVHY
jgi:hypothetical protein